MSNSTTTSSKQSWKRTLKLTDVIKWLRKYEKVYPEFTVTNIVDMRVESGNTPKIVVELESNEQQLHS